MKEKTEEIQSPYLLLAKLAELNLSLQLDQIEGKEYSKQCIALIEARDKQIQTEYFQKGAEHIINNYDGSTKI
jgi:hypothetical protein